MSRRGGDKQVKECGINYRGGMIHDSGLLIIATSIRKISSVGLVHRRGGLAVQVAALYSKFEPHLRLGGFALGIR